MLPEYKDPRDMSFEDLARDLFRAAHNYVYLGNGYRKTFKDLYDELMRRYHDTRLLEIAKEVIAHQFDIPQKH